MKTMIECGAYLETRVVQYEVHAAILEGVDIVPNGVLVVLQDKLPPRSLRIPPHGLQIGYVGVGHVREKRELLG